MAVAAVVALGSLAYSVYKESEAQKGIRDLEKQKRPNYGVAPELRNAFGRAEQMAQSGYTPSERAAYMGSLNRANNLSYRRATDASGGNLARAIGAGIQSNNINQLQQFAASDAALKRQNIRYSDSLAQALQHQQNLASQVDINYRNAEEQAYGISAQQQGQNIQQGVMALGQLAYAKDYGSLNSVQRTTGPQTPQYPNATPLGDARVPGNPIPLYKAPPPANYTNNSIYGGLNQGVYTGPYKY